MCADSPADLALELLFLPAEPTPAPQPCLTSRSLSLAKNARKTATRKNTAGRSSSKSRGRTAAPASTQRKAKKPTAGLVDLDLIDETATVNGAAVDPKLDAFEDDEAELEQEAVAEETSLDDEIGGSSVCIDDPVRMYLMQMGEIPLLTRPHGTTTTRLRRRNPLPRSGAGDWSHDPVRGEQHLVSG